MKFGFGGLCMLFLVFYLGYWSWRVGRQVAAEQGDEAKPMVGVSPSGAA